MPDGYFLTETDLKVIKDLIERVRRFDERAYGRNPYETTKTAPETYVARVPSGGIPGLTEESGAGIVDTPGVEECDIYQLVDDSGTYKLRPTDVKDRKIYNVQTAAVSGNSWVVVSREKYGRWIALPAGGRNGRFARLTNERSGTALPEEWKWVEQTLNATTNQWEDVGGESADFTARPLPYDGTYSCASHIGMRVWLWDSRKSGKYEFLPIGYATRFNPGIVSVVSQEFAGDKTFVSGHASLYRGRIKVHGEEGVSDSGNQATIIMAAGAGSGPGNSLARLALIVTADGSSNRVEMAILSENAGHSVTWLEDTIYGGTCILFGDVGEGNASAEYFYARAAFAIYDGNPYGKVGQDFTASVTASIGGSYDLEFTGGILTAATYNP